MRSLAIEVGRQGVTVNAVMPGWIATGSQLPEEVIAFLASDAASYITGQGIVVDGGNTIQEFKGPSEAWY